MGTTTTTNPVAAKLAETSYYKLAAEVDVTPSFLSRMFRRERSPTVRTGRRIALALGVTMEELFEYIGWPDRPDRRRKNGGRRKRG